MTIEEQIRRTKVAIDTTLHHPELLKKLTVYGYNKDKMLTGKGLYEKVISLNSAQQKEYGESYDATDSLHIAKAEARQLYMHHVSTARFALKNDRGFWKTLQLSGNRKKGLFGWLEQAQVFYANIGEVMDIIIKYNITEAELEQGQAMVEAVFEAYETRRKELNEARQSTQKRDEALHEMNAWMSRFIRIAELAFDDDAEALEMLGLLKKTSTTK